ncbi:ABC transporter ATP-binding protein [Paenibacillus enshidis]|uniref:ABC transporter ATP-binding protein n=1 Tax=Paenibacillus enshidis TaxID=1458439 RepID=A0ABV5AYF2_9BACL
MKTSAAQTTSPLLEISNMVKRYGEVKALNGVSLDLKEGEIISVLGPSGCGKSTLLQLVAGLAQPDEGEIRLLGQKIASSTKMVPPEKRGVNMVFQDYALWPHMNVYDNVAYGLKQKRLGTDAIRKKVQEALALLHLEGFEHRLPPQLSGGQQQRVAIARALVTEPRLMLLDEPLSNLDMRLRIEMRSEMAVLFRRLKMSVFHVTHDPEEAFAMADRLLIMRSGAIDQFASPIECYNRPASRQAASLLGAINHLSGEFVAAPHGLALKTAAGILQGVHCEPGNVPREGTAGEVRFRPEALTVHTANESQLANSHDLPKHSLLEAQVIHCTFEGSHWRSLLECGEGSRLYMLSAEPLQPGNLVSLKLPREAAFLYAT